MFHITYINNEIKVVRNDSPSHRTMADNITLQKKLKMQLEQYPFILGIVG